MVISLHTLWSSNLISSSAKMKTAIISGILLFGAVFINARPQNFGASSAGRQRGGRGGSVNVECTRREVSPGQYAFNCERADGGNQEDLTLRSEHVLWIQQTGSGDQVIDALVPNYRIDELIKAGFKGSADGSTRVNILLKKPEQNYNAELGPQTNSDSPPSVNVEYEPVEKLLVHYPNDKAYSPNNGPILPPA